MGTNLFITAATILAWIAIAILAFALFGDTIIQQVKRRRGTARKRCPKCWYDLSHTVARLHSVKRAFGPRESTSEPRDDGDSHGRDAGATEIATHWSITCSECGRVVMRDRHLYKGRKRWKLAMAALVLLLGSYALRVTPAVQQRGWVAAVPTTAIMLSLPWLQPMPLVSDARLGTRPATTISDLLAEELVAQRIGGERPMWKLQERLLAERCLRGDARRRPVSQPWLEYYGVLLHLLAKYDPQSRWLDRAEALIEVEIVTRPRWPVDAPIYARLAIHRWNDDVDHLALLRPVTPGFVDVEVIQYNRRTLGADRTGWIPHLKHLGASAGEIDHVRYHVTVDSARLAWGSLDTPRRVAGFPLIVPVQVSGSVDDILTPVEDPLVDAAFRAQLDPYLILRREDGVLRPVVFFLWSQNTERVDAFPPLAGVTLALDMDVLYDGALAGNAKARFAGQVDTFRGEPAVIWMGQRPEMQWQINWDDPTDPPETWTLRIRSDPIMALRNFDSDRYWKGEIEVPLRVEVRE